ncbi:MAG: putative DNA-methyltransferase [Chloroflexi bacterium]|nr:putative DNA-methyltransferase [Chloroflexota bacterium]
MDSGVVAAAMLTSREAFTEGLAGRFDARVAWLDAGNAPARPGADSHVRAAAAAIALALEGDDGSIVTITIDLGDRPAWDQAVLGAVRAIPRGEVRSYGEIARAIGRPGAARAVGGAAGRNPVAFLIPCHRVVAGDGTLGGYGGGWWGDHERLLDLKADLLAREGITLPRSRSRGTGGR